MARYTTRDVSGLAALGRFTELRHRILFVLGALVIYRIGTYIPVPGINADALAELFSGTQSSIIGLFNMFSGGALKRFSVFALGIMPYISASIIMQLMTIRAASRWCWRRSRRSALPWPSRLNASPAACPS